MLSKNESSLIFQIKWVCFTIYSIKNRVLRIGYKIKNTLTG